MIKAFGITVLFLLSLGAFILYRTGAFKAVTIGGGEQGPFFLVYKLHRGPYHKIAPLIDSVETFFKEHERPCPLTFGRYLHDPHQVPHDRLESHGGCAFLKKDKRLLSLVAQGGYEMEEVPKKEYVVAHFEGSPSIGPLKVYGSVKKWLARYGYEQQGPVIEIYQTTSEDSLRTRYLFSYK